MLAIPHTGLLFERGFNSGSGLIFEDLRYVIVIEKKQDVRRYRLTSKSSAISVNMQEIGVYMYRGRTRSYRHASMSYFHELL